MKYINFVFVLAITLAILIFTVNNPAMVEIDLWPVVPGPVQVPIFVVMFFGIFFGLIVGFIVSWFAGGRSRRRARALQQRIENDQREMAMLRKQVGKFEAAEREARIPLPPATAA